MGLLYDYQEISKRIIKDRNCEANKIRGSGKIPILIETFPKPLNFEPHSGTLNQTVLRGYKVLVDETSPQLIKSIFREKRKQNIYKIFLK